MKTGKQLCKDYGLQSYQVEALCGFFWVRVEGHGPSRYEVGEAWPTPEEVRAKIKEKFSTTVEDLISNATGELSGLRDELDEWLGNLPEQFQNGDKGSELQEAIDNLESICGNLEIDICIKYLSLPETFIPWKCQSRSERAALAQSQLVLAQDILQGELDDLEEGSDAAQELQEWLSTLEDASIAIDDITWPRMMG